VTDLELLAGLAEVVRRQDLALAERPGEAPAALNACNQCNATWYGMASEPCDWCLERRVSDATWILRPPQPRGYGYATDADLEHLGYHPEIDRARDLEHWRHDMQTAADAGLITET
jgi:hypothetical protein